MYDELESEYDEIEEFIKQLDHEDELAAKAYEDYIKDSNIAKYLQDDKMDAFLSKID